MQLTNKQQTHLIELLADLNKYCDKNEIVKPVMKVFKCGTVEIFYQLYFEGKPIALGNYSELLTFINEGK